MEAIPLSSLLPEGFDPKQYKVHFAVWNQMGAALLKGVLGVGDEGDLIA